MKQPWPGHRVYNLIQCYEEGKSSAAERILNTPPKATQLGAAEAGLDPASVVHHVEVAVRSCIRSARFIQHQLCARHQKQNTNQGRSGRCLHDAYCLSPG